MAIGHRKPGARALLFDRLVGPETAGGGAEPAPITAFYDEEGLQQSVFQQLHWLLNSRVAVDYQTLDGRIREALRSSVDYGIPDLSGYSVGEEGAMRRLADHLAQTIACFEPRLTNTKVVLGAVDERNQRLAVSVSGNLTADMVVI